MAAFIPEDHHTVIEMQDLTSEEVSMLGRSHARSDQEEVVRERNFLNTPFFTFMWLIISTDSKYYLERVKEFFSRFQGLRIKEWISTYQLTDEEEWFHNARAAIASTAGLVFGLSIGVLVAPPGGFVSAGVGETINSVEDRNHKNVGAPPPGNNPTIHAGEAVSGSVFPSLFDSFLNSISTSMLFSFIILAAILSGKPIKHRFSVWLCSMLMCANLLAFTSDLATIFMIITPEAIWQRGSQYRQILYYIWEGSLYLAMGFLTTKFGIWWLVRKVSTRTFPDI